MATGVMKVGTGRSFTAWRHLRRCQLGRHNLGTHICRVTNLNEEKPSPPKDVRITQQFIRDGKPLRNEIMVDMFEGVRDETISHADMEYWFRDNPEDIIKERFVETLEEIPNTDFTVRNEAWDSAPIGTLTEGDILTAEVDGTHLYHGAVIDLGTQYHGVIPVMEEQWPFVLDLLELGAKVKVRVHKIRDPKFFRFPIQLDVLEPDCSEFLTPADEYEPPMTLHPDMDPMEVIAKSERNYQPGSFYSESPEHDPDPIIEKLAFRDRFGPGTEMPYLMREERGELTPEEIEEEDSDSDEEHIMDVDTMLANEALSRHLG